LNELFHPRPQIKEVGSDILCCEFLTDEGIDMLLSCIKDTDEWTSNYRDPDYFTQDLHFKTSLPGFYEILKDYLESEIHPLASAFWGVPDFKVKDLFAVRYTLDTQTSLKLHHDSSFITGSVKLNSDYTGALLNFPRKKFTNENIKVGSLLLWPGNITHQHECTSLLEGEKYSLTIWTDECLEL